MKLTAHQQQAMNSLLEFVESNNALAVLEGFAGVGKTFLMAEFLKQVSGRLSVCVAAPTHKALKVICSTLELGGVDLSKKADDDDLSGGMFAFYARKQALKGISTATIHSLLALKMIEHENGEAECLRDERKMPTLSDHGLVVIDESSLISRQMFEMILTHKNSTKVLFIGDPAQLPPIGDKNNISPVFTQVSIKVRLNEIVRQAADNPVIKLSMAIRNKAPQLKFSIADFLAELPPMPASAACVSGNKETLINFAATEHKQGRDARVLCYRNQSVSEINKQVHDLLHPGTIFAADENILCYFSAGADGSKSPFQEDDDEGDEHNARLMDEFKVISCTDLEQYDAGIEVMRLILETESGKMIKTLIPKNQIRYQREISRTWELYRSVNAAYLMENDAGKKEQLKQEKSTLSRKAYAMRNRYPDLRHAYAMTVHRSQGSTFDTALVHYADLNTMRSAFEFNRALYVACTRPRQYLAVVV